MERNKVESQVAEQVEKIIGDTEIELVDVEYVKEKEWYLRVFLDKSGGIDIEDCQFVSRALDEWLEEKDPIPYSYHLEVSSPGLDRPLKKAQDFNRNIGKIVEVSFFAPWEGKKQWIGALNSFSEESLTLEIEDQLSELPRKKIAQIRLHLG